MDNFKHTSINYRYRKAKIKLGNLNINWEDCPIIGLRIDPRLHP